MNGSSRMNACQYSGRFNGSDHEYTLSEPTAVANGADWLHLSTCPSSKDTLQGSTRFLNTWKTVSHELQSTFWPFILDQTMNIHFLSQLQWLIVQTGSISTPFHPEKTLYHVPQGSSIAGKTVFPWTQMPQSPDCRTRKKCSGDIGVSEKNSAENSPWGGRKTPPGS